MYKYLLIVLFSIISTLAFSQDITQNIKGQIIDESSQEPIPFANIIIQDSSPSIGTISDENGYFTLSDLPPGRYNIHISFLGYETIIVNEILLTSAKEVNLTIELNENIAALDAIILRPKIHKEKALNKMASVSARMLSVEEANRYAGGFDDPARLASSFAGVASNVSNNAIIIRGNAPKYTQWKMEGIEIPNPNHFADLGTFGGGGLTALSSNLLANSDFFTGAFPAEHNNALSGVFDMRMRSGNNSEYEHSAELGLIGIDFASEGPINKNSHSSYLVNYRYSTLGLLSSILPEDTEGTNYQDVAFKLRFPTKKVGTFSFWGLGLIDNSGKKPEEDINTWEYNSDREKEKATQFMGASGINHRMFFNGKGSLNSTLAISANGLDFTTERLDDSLELQPLNEINNNNYNITFKSVFNKKFSANHRNNTGISAVNMNYDLLLNEVNNTTLETIVSEKGSSTLLSAFTSSNFSFKDFTLNVGLTSQLFTLNNNFTLEPRLGMSYQINANNELSFGYGLHSRLERLNVYFTNPENSETLPNKELDFTKAHHFILGYNWNINKNLHLKVEPYYQYLYNVPIVENSTTSLINLVDDWFINDIYINEGIGQNYGIDVTLEKYITNGFYYLITASVFNSQFQTDSGVWFNTRFNRGYLINALAGKEFLVGKQKQNLFSINLRLSLQGGDRYSMIDEAASDFAQEVVYDETTPFTEQSKDMFITHITANYQWNKKKTSHKLSLKILNANKFEEFFGHRYNLKTQTVDKYREAILIPNLSYKISF